MNLIKGTKSMIHSLPRPEAGEVAYATDTNELYIFNDNQWVLATPETKGNVEMSLYDMNKQIITQLPTMKRCQEKTDLMNDFVKQTNNVYYMLYGKEISYFTVFVTNMFEYEIETLGDAVYECLSNVGPIKSIEYTENKDAIEIWVMADEEATCLYLFPYDGGIVKVGR